MNSIVSVVLLEGCRVTNSISVAIKWLYILDVWHRCTPMCGWNTLQVLAIAHRPVNIFSSLHFKSILNVTDLIGLFPHLSIHLVLESKRVPSLCFFCSNSVILQIVRLSYWLRLLFLTLHKLLRIWVLFPESRIIVLFHHILQFLFLLLNCLGHLLLQLFILRNHLFLFVFPILFFSLQLFYCFQHLLVLGKCPQIWWTETVLRKVRLPCFVWLVISIILLFGGICCIRHFQVELELLDCVNIILLFFLHPLQLLCEFVVLFLQLHESVLQKLETVFGGISVILRITFLGNRQLFHNTQLFLPNFDFQFFLKFIFFGFDLEILKLRFQQSKLFVLFLQLLDFHFQIRHFWVFQIVSIVRRPTHFFFNEPNVLLEGVRQIVWTVLQTKNTWRSILQILLERTQSLQISEISNQFSNVFVETLLHFESGKVERVRGTHTLVFGLLWTSSRTFVRTHFFHNTFETVDRRYKFTNDFRRHFVIITNLVQIH